MPDSFDHIDWSLTTWKGSRREQFRRWAELDFDEILHAQEEMAELAAAFGHDPVSPRQPLNVAGLPPEKARHGRTK